MNWVELTEYDKKTLVNFDHVLRVEPERVMTPQRTDKEGSKIHLSIPRKSDVGGAHTFQAQESPEEIERLLQRYFSVNIAR